MFINDYLPLELLMEWIDKLEPGLEEKYKMRGTLFPKWKNFFTFQVDRFDRYPEMITHGSTHICNVLSLAAEFLVPVFNQWNRNRQKYTGPPMSGEELFLLVSAIFLHDIGMADVAEVSPRPDEVRKKHSVLSGDILRGRFKRGQSEWNLLPTFETIEEVDVLAEICIHHQTSAPLAKKDKKKGNTAHTLEDECELNDYLNWFNGKKIDIFMVTALLRMLDACDVQYSRAGSVFFTSVKMRNNRRLRDECKKRLPDTRGELKSFYTHYDRYLRLQETQHFPKHSLIQKVWIIHNEVVYKPITKYERRKLAAVLPDAAIEPEPFFEEFEKEIQKEINVCTPYLKNKGLTFENVRPFNENTDPPLIAGLASYSKKWHRLPRLKTSYLARKGFESGLAKRFSQYLNRPNILLFAGPSGVGKTSLSVKLAQDLAAGSLNGDRAEKPRVCHIALDFTETMEAGQMLKAIVTRFTYFLAAWGDYLFYNKLRMELDMEEAQWNILLDRLDDKRHFFIFDDFHLLPVSKRDRQSKSEIQLIRFFNHFFEKIGSGEAKAMLFTQKVPEMLTLQPDIGYEVIHIPDFNDADIKQLSEGPSFTGFKGSQWKEGKNAAESLIRKYSGFPVVLEYIRKEMAFISLDEPEAAKWLHTIVERRMKHHIRSVYKVLKSEGPSVFDFFLFLQHQADGVLPNFDDLAERCGLKREEVAHAWTVLEKRHLFSPGAQSDAPRTLNPQWTHPLPSGEAP